MTDLGAAPLIAGVARIVLGHDGEDHVLGRPDLGVYIAVPEPGAVFVEALQGGASLDEATAQASESAGEPVDGQDFLGGLTDSGLLDAPADAPGTSATRAREIRWIEGVSPRTASYVCGRMARCWYVAATGFVVATLLLVPSLRPSFEQVWWLPDPVSSVLALVPVTLGLGALHEAWHWLAGRALGVPATFRLSQRGIFLVFETDLTQILVVPRRRRYFAFISGMAFDVSVLAIALGLRLADRELLVALPGWLGRFLGAVALGLVFRITWQFFGVVFRSDMYAVLANALRCNDLHRATWLTTRDRLIGLDDARRAELAAIDEHDRMVARWFGAAYLVGALVMVWFALEFGVPGVIGLLGWAVVNLSHPDLLTWAFWSSLLVAVYVATGWLLPPALAVRERRLRRAGALR